MKTKLILVRYVGIILMAFAGVGLLNAYYGNSTQTESITRLFLAAITGIPGGIMMYYSSKN